MAKVAILLALCNGAAHLRMQIDSYLAQDLADWQLLVSDDGSVDAGPAIVREYAERLASGRVQMMAGPRLGPAANFLHLLRAVPSDCTHAAFSDQDDVWFPHKLQRAVVLLQAAGDVNRTADPEPAIYCSRRIVCDENLARQRPSARARRQPGFRNALVENIVAGNTLVLNRAAIDLLCAAMGSTAVVMHDWWAYQVITGAGGRVVLDDEPGLLYRQHSRNMVGANEGALSWMRRVQKAAGGRYKDWNDRNIAALSVAGHLLTAENRALLARFSEARSAGLVQRISGLRRLGLYRQRRLEQIAFWVAAVLGRV